MYNVSLLPSVIEEVPGMRTQFIISDSAGWGVGLGVGSGFGGVGGGGCIAPVSNAPAVYDNMLSAACHLLPQT